MTQLGDPHFRILQFYTTAPYACSYLPGHSAPSQVATPTHLINGAAHLPIDRIAPHVMRVFRYAFRSPPSHRIAARGAPNAGTRGSKPMKCH